MEEQTDLLTHDYIDNDALDSQKFINAINEDNFEAIKLYLEKNIFSDYLDDDENSLVHIAVIKRNRRSLLTFLEYGIEPNQLNSLHQTALHIAILQKDILSAELLLKHGADYNITDNQGNSAIDMAKSIGFKEFIELSKKIKTNKDSFQSNISPENVVNSIYNELILCSADVNIDQLIKNVISLCDQYLSTTENILKSEISFIKKTIKPVIHKIFSNLNDIQNLSETEKFKLIRKFLSAQNAILLAKLSSKNLTEVIQKLSKLENYLEEKVISSNVSAPAKQTTLVKNFAIEKLPNASKNHVRLFQNIKNILEEKRNTEGSSSPYHYLDYKNENILCRQTNRDMCHIDKLTIKTHHPINISAANAIINSLENDVDSKIINEAKKIINSSGHILTLLNSKKFDEIVRPGKKEHIHLVYFCSQNTSFEENLDLLSRITLNTGCTLHCFNYPGINNSEGVVDEKKDLIYAGLAVINKLLLDKINIDKVIMFSDSESYAIIKNVAKQFLLRELKISRIGVLDLSNETSKRKFKPSTLRKFLLYYNPNKTDLTLYPASTKEEKLMEKLNDTIFYGNKPNMFEGKKNLPSVISQIKRYISVNQNIIQLHPDLHNSIIHYENVDTIKGEIQI